MDFSYPVASGTEPDNDYPMAGLPEATTSTEEPTEGFGQPMEGVQLIARPIDKRAKQPDHPMGGVSDVTTEEPTQQFDHPMVDLPDEKEVMDIDEPANQEPDYPIEGVPDTTMDIDEPNQASTSSETPLSKSRANNSPSIPN